MIRSLLALCLLGIFPRLFAQSHYEPAHIITNSGDTLRGYVDNREWRKNPQEISFRHGEDGAPVRKFGVSELGAFVFDNGPSYVRAIISEDGTPDTVFLKLLVWGRTLSLYQLTKDREHYYISPGHLLAGSRRVITPDSIVAQDEFTELEYGSEEVQTDDGYTAQKEIRTYRIQLKAYVKGPDSAAIARSIDDLPYMESALTKVIVSINGQGNVIIVSDHPESKRIVAQFYVGAGVQSTFMKFDNSNEVIGGMHFDPAFGPRLSAGVDFLSRQNWGDLTARVEAAYWSADCKGTVANVLGPGTYEMKVNAVTASVNLLYSFYRTENLRIYAGAGIGFNFCSYPTHVYYVDGPANGAGDPNYAVPDNFWINFNARAGIKWSRHFGAEIQSETGSCINYNQINARLNGYSLKLLYYF